MVSLTREQVVGLYAHMMQAFRAALINKRSAAEMALVSVLLGRLGIVDRQAFMQRFATTVGRRIYVPFTPGVATADWSLNSQAVVCVHECHHVHQWDRLGPAMFTYQYVASKARRTLLEVEAYRTSMEVRWRLDGVMPDPARLASSLRSYGVSEADVMVAERMLRASVPTVRAGGITSPATKAAVDWLKSKGVLS